jgi:putative N-acetylmannosamine-6-phosphate epimerase
MFKLIITVRRGSASTLDAASTTYATIEAARLGGAAALRHERVQRVMIVRDEIPPAFVEWLER